MYINEDKMPTKARRAVQKTTKEELWDLMFDYAKSHDKYCGIDENYDFEEDDCGITVLENILRESEYANADLNQINVDMENMTCDSDSEYGKSVAGENLLNLQDNGKFAFFGFQLGGDWEYPVYAMVYYDGERLRVYYPTCGNPINVKYRCAYGSEPNEEIDKTDWDAPDFGFNWNLIAEDIEKTFVFLE